MAPRYIFPSFIAPAAALAAVMVAVLAAPVARAGDYYSYGGYGGGSYGGSYYGGGHGGFYGGGNYGGHHHHYTPPPPPAPQPVVQQTTASTNTSRRYYYPVHATTGNYNFRTAGSGWDSRTGYEGAYAPTNSPHRSDWEAYLLRLQRQSRQQQQVESPQPRILSFFGGAAPASNDPCGNYLRAPAGCRNSTTRYDPIRYVEVRYIPEVSGAFR